MRAVTPKSRSHFCDHWDFVSRSPETVVRSFDSERDDFMGDFHSYIPPVSDYGFNIPIHAEHYGPTRKESGIAVLILPPDLIRRAAENGDVIVSNHSLTHLHISHFHHLDSEFRPRLQSQSAIQGNRPAHNHLQRTSNRARCISRMQRSIFHATVESAYLYLSLTTPESA